MTAKASFAIAILAPALALPGKAQTAPTPALQIETHTRLAQQYIRQNRPQQAIPEFQKVVDLAPGNVNAQTNLGVLLYFSGQYEQAEPHLRAALAIDPSIPKLQALLGLCERRNNELEAARNDLKAALPTLQDPKIKRQAGLELVDLDTAQNDLPAAAIVIDSLKAALPTDPEVLYANYRVHTDLANEALLDLSVAAPNSGQTHQAMAHELARTGNTEGVITNLRLALKADPNLPGAHYELAQALHNSTQPAQKAEAESEFQQALLQSPNDDKVLTSLGDLLAEKQDHPAAIARYKQALALQPRNDDASVGLAHELTETGHPEEALPLLLAIEKQDPTNILVHYRLSAIYRRLHRTDDAKHEVAEYERLKTEKEKLRGIYEAMRLTSPQAVDARD